MLLTAARPALANALNFGSEACNSTIDSQCVAKTGSLVWYPSGVNASIVADFQWVDTNKYDPIAYVQMIKTTSPSSADTWIYDDNYGLNGIRAFTRCSLTASYGTRNGETWCEPQIIGFNNGQYPGEYNNYYERRFVACHEIAHILGLHHPSPPNSSCITDIALASPLSEYSSRQGLLQHDIDHLEGFYEF
ncbi:MAG: hypothetical protein ACRDHD_04815 [Candidatus Limnocylindria bacterium]